VAFSDGTTAGYVVEELLRLRPHREPVETQMKRNGSSGSVVANPEVTTQGNNIVGKTAGFGGMLQEVAGSTD
jgi:hypothetical protein